MQNRIYRHLAAFLSGVLIGGLVVYGFVAPETVSPEPRIPTFDVTEVVSGDAAMAPALPTRLRIPYLKMDVPFSDPLGVTADGVVEVPDSYDTVGWYQYGPTPGELGPAVVLGHVDSYVGPAVFFSLGQLREGDDIYIDRVDGSVAHFRVTQLIRPDQSEFPTDAVYGDLPFAGLRLITCTGRYDRSVRRYTHNLIVFAKLVNPAGG